MHRIAALAAFACCTAACFPAPTHECCGEEITGACNLYCPVLLDGGTPDGSSSSPATSCSPAPAADAGIVSAVVAGNNALALNLFPQLAAQVDGGNLFFSPFSITAAFAMTYAGAAGSTQAQFAQTFGFPGTPAEVAPAFGALDCQLLADGASPDGGQLDIANALFGQQGFTFEPTFLSLLSTGYGAPLQTVDFHGDMNGAVQTINAWVDQHTDGMIPAPLQPSSLPPDTVFALADALYFDGLWVSPFDPNATTPQPFTTASGQVVQQPMMVPTGEAGYPVVGYYAGSGFEVAELPYRSHVAMDVFLPDTADGLPALEAQLTPANASSWLGALSPTQVVLELPKFQLDSRPSVKPALQALGLTAPFVSGEADFSGIDGSNDIYLNAVIHEAVLDVDEAGTRAAAVTIIGGGAGAATEPPSIRFVVNHPFLVMLRDTVTGTVLFLGQVTNPAA